MPLIAKASKTVRNKNLIMALACLAFSIWFAYDGWVGYAAKDDALVARMKQQAAKGDGLGAEDLPLLEQWKPGDLNQATAAISDQIYDKIVTAKHVGEGEWKSSHDIWVQRSLVGGLLLATLGALAWTLACQRRRVTADDTGLSPAPGMMIPWANITKVDNLLWKKKGYVHLEYRDAAGATQKAVLDDYIVDDLVPILELLGEKADKAQFIDPAPEPSANEAKDADAQKKA
jgi:hypothetical protein